MNIMNIKALAGTWIAECDACGQTYPNHVGSTQCCGSIATIIENIVTPEQQAEVDAAILAAFQRAKEPQ